MEEYRENDKDLTELEQKEQELRALLDRVSQVTRKPQGCNP